MITDVCRAVGVKKTHRATQDLLADLWKMLLNHTIYQKVFTKICGATGIFSLEQVVSILITMFAFQQETLKVHF